MREYRRRHYFVDKGYQGRVIKSIALICFVGLLLSLCLFNYFSFGKVEALRWKTHIAQYTVGDIVRPYLIYSSLIGIAATVLALYFLLNSILKETAGPIYRMAKDISDATGGDLSRDVFLRRGDDFKETASELNKMIISLRTNLKGTIEKFGDIRRSADSLEYVMDRPQIADQKCRQLLDDLEALKQISSKYG